MSNFTAPTINFDPAFIAFCEASIALNNSQLGNAAAVPTATAKPAVKPATAKPAATAAATLPTGDLGFGFKKDGTPRKKADPVWLRNGAAKPAAAAKPAKPAKSAKPAVKPATIATPTIADEPAWRSELARNGSSQHIRILAAELALYGAKSRKLTVNLTAKCATKGAASDHYKSLSGRVAAKKLDIRSGSANWKLAAAIIARMPVA